MLVTENIEDLQAALVQFCEMAEDQSTKTTLFQIGVTLKHLRRVDSALLHQL